jgi:two-component system alkaline phosphatase synthesis response regulator PhoP
MAVEKKTIVIIEDERDLASLLRDNLVHEGFLVNVAASGEEGLKIIERNRPDLVLLDWMLPGMNGLDVCRQLRRDAKTASVPVIMVTAKGQESDVVVGLEVGADDYVPKPFSMKVLISRIRVALRRQHLSVYDEKSELRVRDMEISPSRFLVTVKGKAIEGLTLTEFRLLHFLASRAGRVFNRQQILDAVQGEHVAVTERAVDVQMVGLRKKLGGRADCIEAVRGIGYRFREG